MSVTLATVLRRLPDVRYRRVKHEWVVIRQKEGEVLVLNESAGRLLELLDGRRTLGDLIGLLTSEFHTDREALQSDVLRFAAEIETAGLGEAVDGTDA